jgi:TIR domain-containing protein/uncharacterized protein DUF4062/NB-ARC domain-containing protein
MARRVFISHTAELRELAEGGSYIAAVEAAVTAGDCVVLDMAYYTASDLPPAELDRDNVAKADIYLLVAGFHYGAPVRERPELSYTEHEFEVASELGMPRLVFLLSENATGPGWLFRDLRYGVRQEAFRWRLRDSGVTVREVTSPDDLKAAVLQALTAQPRVQGRNTESVRVWGIPAQQARFTGRENHLAQLRAALTAHTPAVVHALNGMAGVGKTTLAIEYAYQYADNYDIAWWIPAEDSAQIANHLATLAHALDLAGSADTTSAAIARLLGGLRKLERWLVVFDNADNPQALREFLPGGPGHVLITSRNPDWDNLAVPVEISEFLRSESVALMRARLPQLSDNDAEQLAEALGDLPLAVDQAAALLADTRWTVADYLEMLESNTQRLLGHRGHAGSYPTSVAAAWQLTIGRLADTEPAAAQLLTLAAWLAPEPVPLALFTEHPDTLPEPLATIVADRIAWVDLLALVRRRAVARVSPDSIALHRIPTALLRTDSPVAAPPNGWATVAARLRGTATIPSWREPGTVPAGVRGGPGVFINYRGEDSHSYSALLYTELARQFGDEHVFLDAESIPAGADFVTKLLNRARSARVLLTVIGPRWLTATNPTTGRRRIDDPSDWIRRELAEAFASGVRVIPVLTDQAELPSEADLPDDIAALSRCQYRRLRRRKPVADLARIVADLTSLGERSAAEGERVNVSDGFNPAS